jgi:hypothetical protein
LVRKVPPEDVAVSMTVAPEALDPLLEEEDPAGEAGAAAVPLLAALLQAATTTAAPSAPPTPATILVRLDRRLNLDFCIVLISRPARVTGRLRVIHCR